MFTSLRARLWVTYAVLILLILSILAAGAVIYIIRNPLIDRQALSRLEAVLTLVQRQLQERANLIRDELTYLERVSDSFNVRVILFSSDRQVVLDTEAEGSGISWPSGENLPPRQGRIDDLAGKTWLYHSQLLPSGEILVLALPRQGGLGLLRAAQFRETLREDFLPTFFRAGLLAFVLAVIFAAWMGSWIANPLEEIEKASQAVSQGQYQTITSRGPEEVQALAGAFNDMVGRVQTTQQSQKDFVANVSHELKTPLTSIQGFSQAILDGAADSGPALQKAAGIIKTEADRMYRLVVDLLDLARFDAGTVDLDRQPLDLAQLLRDVGSQLIPQAVDAQVKLTLDIDPLPACLGDRDRLAQVFTNLVDNALKHTPAGGFVSLGARSEGNWARVEVIDSGSGIAPEHLDRIFERFYKIDGSRKGAGKPGTGLGLAIAQGIVLAHGGAIGVRSTVGEGAAFEVRLPLIKPDGRIAGQAREGHS